MSARGERICSLLVIIAALMMMGSVQLGSRPGTICCAIIIVIVALLPLVVGRREVVRPTPNIVGLLDLPPEQQLVLATKLAANIGYQVTPEPKP